MICLTFRSFRVSNTLLKREEAGAMFAMHIRPEVLKRLREEYPPGCTVELIEMNDPYRSMPTGMRGKVTLVDDAGGIHVAWENGSTLAAIHGIDRIKRID
jgi:hypothetical protein